MLCIQNAICSYLDDYSLCGTTLTDLLVQSILVKLEGLFITCCMWTGASKITPLREFDYVVWNYNILYHPEQEPKNT